MFVDRSKLRRQCALSHFSIAAGLKFMIDTVVTAPSQSRLMSRGMFPIKLPILYFSFISVRTILSFFLDFFARKTRRTNQRVRRFLLRNFDVLNYNRSANNNTKIQAKTNDMNNCIRNDHVNEDYWHQSEVKNRRNNIRVVYPGLSLNWPRWWRRRNQWCRWRQSSRGLRLSIGLGVIPVRIAFS